MPASGCAHSLRAIVDRADNSHADFDLDKLAKFLPSFRL
jgi:hypothetical protein